MPGFPGHEENWLVVEPTHLKNISQIGNLPQIGVKIKNIGNHHLENHPKKVTCRIAGADFSLFIFGGS